MKKHLISLITILVAALLLTGCGQAASGNDSSSDSTEQTVVALTDVYTYEYKDSDLTADYDAGSAVYVDLTSLSEATYTISQAGTYVLSGSYSGQLVIKAGDDDKVQLVFNGVTITNDSGPAVYILSGDKVTLTLAAGSVNSVADGSSYAADDEGADAAIYSKSDLAINGSGSLTVSGQLAHGIVSKDNLVITGGIINVTAVKDGLRGKDCVAISDGTITIVAGSDGIYSSNTDSNKGFIVINGGSITITSATDGIQAASSLAVTAGTIVITAGTGSSSVTLTSDASGPFVRTASADATESCKGLKAGGSISLDCADDAIHCSGDIQIAAGQLELKSGDDAIHADGQVTISGGTFAISYFYEGIEGSAVTVNDGIIDIVSSDDGINAAGGADSSGTAGGWNNTFSVQTGCDITINGGTITIVSDGDCLDANGSITINGGTLDLTCNGNGNTAIDTNGTYTHNGGSVTTNDNSENGSSFSGGNKTNRH